MKSSLKLFEDAKNLLDVLKNKKISTAIVTNFDSDGNSLSKSLGIPDLVDFVITSKDAEAPKPSNKIFDYALNYNALANSDDGTCDVEGCTDSNYVEYDIYANIDDGSCLVTAIPGCTNNMYLEYL